MKVSVPISRGIESLFGTRDENIRVLEQSLSLKTRLLNDSLEVEGEEENVTRAANILEESGVDAAVINARYAKPLDEALILHWARETNGIITAEENVRAGGFGDAVLELLADHGLAGKNLLNLAMPDEIVDHGPQATFRQMHHLDGPGIAEGAQRAIESAASAGETTEHLPTALPTLAAS